MAARLIVESGFTERYDYALQTLTETAPTLARLSLHRQIGVARLPSIGVLADDLAWEAGETVVGLV